MSRILKKNINTSFFHIMVQGINKEYIFDSQENINKYMELMKDTKEKINTVILAYCIMNNHAHFLFCEEDINKLIKFMHRVNLLYAKYYNKKYDRVGYVFRDRYKTQPIYTEKHLYCCVSYIHNNPVKANICDKAKEYKYSSYNNNVFYTDTEIERNVRKFMYNKEFQENEDKEFVFLENEQNKEQICNEIIQETIMENNISKQDFKKNKKLLREIVIKLNYEHDISFRTMEKTLGISRETLRRLI